MLLEVDLGVDFGVLFGVDFGVLFGVDFGVLFGVDFGVLLGLTYFPASWALAQKARENRRRKVKMVLVMFAGWFSNQYFAKIMFIG